MTARSGPERVKTLSHREFTKPVLRRTGKTVSKAIKRAGFLQYFANRGRCIIGMEACGGAQHWARELTTQGHQARLLRSRFVKAFNIGNKSDAADARAIWLAVQQPGKAVAVKTEAQQAVLAMHRMREQLLKMRTMQINALRGLMTEYGEVMGRSRAVLKKEMPGVLHRLAEGLPAMLVDTLRDRWNELARMNEQIAKIEQRLRIWLKQDRDCSAIAEIPGVGLLTATAAVATMADPKAFRSGREFAAFIGLVPRQHGSGGKVSLFGISKRGDTYLCTLLTHGARCVLANAKEPGQWVEQLKKRQPANVVVIALANKLARIIWAVLAHRRPYEKGYSGARPA